MNQTSTQMPLEVALPVSQPTKGEREYEAFLRLLPHLLTTHRGKYVAVHEGEVIDTDTDDIALIERVHRKIGYVPIHVALVTESLPIVRVPHYREHRPHENGA